MKLLHSVAIKVAAVAALVIVILLGGGSYWLMRYEYNTISAYDQVFRQQLTQAIEERAEQEYADLHRNIALHTQILAQNLALFLFNFNDQAAFATLETFMKYAEVKALEVHDDTGDSFAAAWRHRDQIKTAAQLPDALRGTLNPLLQAQADAIHNDSKVGAVTVFYSEERLRAAVAESQNASVKQAEIFYDAHLHRLITGFYWQAAAIFGIVLVLVTLVSLILIRMVRQPLLKLARIAIRLAKLDLTVHVERMTGNSEVVLLSNSLAQSVQSFHDTLTQVQLSGVQMSSATSQLTATSKQHEAVLQSQLEAVSSASQAVMEISAAAEQLRNTLEEVAQTARKTGHFATQGRADLGTMQAAMQHMEHASQEISERLHNIDAKTANITQVITTITKVADQTNLLSLNAAIEAEKAGESGRGFTVVAQEIRRLADQTAVAALDIDSMIEAMQHSVRQGVAGIQNFSDEVHQNAQNVSRISQQLEHIIEHMQTLLPRFDMVNDAVQSQSDNVGQINHVIHNLQEEMQETTSALRESFSSLSQLNEAASRLHQQLARFKVS
jgi:methyl-accepting chemotaxis protein